MSLLLMVWTEETHPGRERDLALEMERGVLGSGGALVAEKDLDEDLVMHGNSGSQREVVDAYLMEKEVPIVSELALTDSTASNGEKEVQLGDAGIIGGSEKAPSGISYGVEMPALLRKCLQAKVRLLPSRSVSVEDLELSQADWFLHLECKSEEHVDDVENTATDTQFTRRIPFVVDSAELWWD